LAKWGLIVLVAVATMGENYAAKEKSGRVYDNIMEWINAL